MTFEAPVTVAGILAYCPRNITKHNISFIQHTICRCKETTAQNRCIKIKSESFFPSLSRYQAGSFPEASHRDSKDANLTQLMVPEAILGNPRQLEET